MSKKRGVLVWCLFGLATILLFVSSLTVWSKRQLLDNEAWAHSSAQLLANDEVRGVIAQKLSDALFQRVDVEAQLRERLPAQRKGTAAALAGALEDTVGPGGAHTGGRGRCWRARIWARTKTSRPRTERSRLT